MRSRPTLILLVLAALATGYFFLVEQPRHERRLTGEESARRLTRIRGDDVYALTIERPDARLEFVREAGQWKMTAPVPDKADRGSVNTLLEAAVGARIERRFTAEAPQLAEYELTPPSAALILADSSQTRLLAVDIGALTLTKTHCYARLSGSQEVLLLPAGLRRYALREVLAFRDKKVADFEVEEVTRFDVASKDHTQSWHRSAEDQWVTYQHGDTIRGDRSALVNILRELRALRARWILKDTAANLDEYFSDPAGTIRLWLGPDSVRNEIRFSGPEEDGCYVKSDQHSRIEFVDAAVLDLFDRTLDDLRDRRVVTFERDRLAKLTLVAGDVTVSIVKADGDWSFTNPDFGAVEQTAVTTLLNELAGLKYREIVSERLNDPGRFGLDPPSFRLTLYDADDRIVDFVATGETRTARRIRYATSLSSKHLGIVDAEPLEEIEGLFADFRPR